MPFIKTPPKAPPRSTLLENRSKKCGPRVTVYSVNGDEYTGEWLDNKKHGWGTQVWKKLGTIYNGEWKCGKRDGYGTYSVANTKVYAKKYCGEWRNGIKHGHGTYFYDNSAVYEGEWSEDRRSGWGRMLFNCGDVYEGEWMKDKEDGWGVLQFANGNWYEGSWKEGKKSGRGKFYYHDKAQLYEGLWVRGEAKCGTLSDSGRDDAPTPAKCPIPEVKLKDVKTVLQAAQLAHLDPTC
ncbi:MORN repeat-containing protein 3 [Nerophis lumbriciformis]|uniref:MORN repeat-containing protein 3 n=1 Tax=Nerophis lumbriciformis TaxID=546530 RepID=UPI002ADF3DCF|nr:MORN repeat-containing protein 3-like [Nerophis lumbriciformis]XP_061783069.1 MORN repeat-containing protein 3-like [Nerophis lumbriciformis]XP_061783070.1 MORN repeat-containing protein 3-like [Nerophis lumbriciformis]